MENGKQSQNNNLEYFIICGLGSLGQHCVAALREFEVKIIAIEQKLPIAWEIESLKDLIDNLIIGDCRHNHILHRAKVEGCRAALIVTTDDRVNVETAIAIRQLNPQTRLVVRSGNKNLNRLLSQQLGNYTAFEPTELSTAAFTLAALGTEILGFFELEGQIWQVYQRKITDQDPWCDRSILSLEDNYQKVLVRLSSNTSLQGDLGKWDSREAIAEGDTIIYLKIARNLDTSLSVRNFASNSTKTKNKFKNLTASS